ncbi:isopentenyl-diphosphate Delta-isomerase [Polymorphum gilvum]|uniref:isopentenyl-diphosphate Delta-isomerase n=1 Tax=Polymorphum gilvum (strain LMG 25793 / CGMCC 1.9160 / SL003B-26A1) TaxID=991905 RepID=F2IXD0_POLGS|nr:NUDIX domain-containing protein [Polymorphum gilvum]ADZ70448.1 Isopentenyl-diphosphate delta-isomerase, type 1 [Polymorphum gilvum SL003B-26A1]
MADADEILIPAIAADGSLFPVGKLRAHREALLHLAVSVFVFDGDALLLQQRALSKYHCGGLWANACCSHPHWDESPAACAARRLKEELGVSLALRPAGGTDYFAEVGGGLCEHERVSFFVADAERARLALAPDPAEVMATRWVTPDTLRRELASSPKIFAPWFRLYAERFPGFVF